MHAIARSESCISETQINTMRPFLTTFNMYLMNHLVDQVYIFERTILGDGNVGSNYYYYYYYYYYYINIAIVITMSAVLQS